MILESMSRDWDPDEALKALAEERTVLDVDLTDPTQVGEAVDNIFRQNATASALRVCHLALHSVNERVSLQAAQYVIERAGRVAEGDNDPIRALLEDIFGNKDASAIS